MTHSEMAELVCLLTVGDRFPEGTEMYCSRLAGSNDKWILTLSINGKPVRMKSNREDVRTFASLDSAYKVASSIVNSMLVIGQ